MPIPKPKQNEDSQKFVSRCMGNETMKKEYPDQKQRVAICLGQTRKKSKGGLFASVLELLGFSLSYNDCEECGDVEEIEASEIIPPNDNDYIDFQEQTEEFIIPTQAKYEYMDPVTYEKYYFERRGNYKKDGRYLRYEGEAKASEYQGRKVTLNKPFRTPDGPKKFSVYVKNDKGNVVKVNFGDPNMKIKKNIPERRKSFRARHNCDNPGPKWKARYWSCKAW
jgi:hypothetical protein